MAAQWSPIHSFFDGWGMQEQIPDNCVVVESHPTAEIPYDVVRNKVEPRIVWAEDAKRWLDLDLFAPGVDVDAVHAQLAPYLAAEAARIAALPLPKFERITLPVFATLLPGMADIRSVLAANPMRLREGQ